MSHEQDTLLKNFWKDNERFADLFNGILFNGQKILNPEFLTEADSDVSEVVTSKEKKTVYKRNRDVVKKMYMGAEFIILGLENQAHIHYAMPLRNMGYDFMNYTKEYNALKQKNRKLKEPTMTRDEFLSGIFKSDRLHPVFTLVIYYGEHPWDGPLSLMEMMTPVPPELLNCFNDYRLNLVQVIDEHPGVFSHPDVAAVFDLIRMIYKKDKKAIQKKYNGLEIDREVFDVVKSITALDLNTAPDSQRGKVKMWTALKEWQQESYESGKQAGYESGKQAGYESGEKAARRQMITQMLKNQWDAETIHEATKVPLEEITVIQSELQL